MNKLINTVVALASLTASAMLYAHHSTVGIFDADRPIEITGIISTISWRNPHGRIVLDVEDEDGSITEWDVETASISILRNRGVSSEVLQEGDRVTVAGQPSRRNEPFMLGTNVLLSSGYEFDFGSGSAYFDAGKNGNLIGQSQPDIDVSQAIAEADGLFRVWSTVMSDPTAFPMYKGNYPLNAEGERELAAWDPNDNILFQCGTKGQPLIMISPIPMDFVRQGDDILMRLEEYDSRRLIHMTAEAEPANENSLFGFSRGRWDGDTLIVETDHIAAGYFDHLGAKQSDQITTVERFIPNTDYSRLDYEITVTDPVYFSEPFTLTRYFVWYPEMSVHDYECLERY
ncbi:MAG: DUF6152 family protein [Gammaproteobacteria bacterium]|nr:DUF6152 family protein [Gammaproteobacteria bacterium]